MAQTAKNTSQAVKTRLNILRKEGLRETFRKAAPALKHAGLSLGTLSAVKIGAMSAAGAAGISGLSAVAIGAAGVGVCATSAQYALDCYKAHKAGEPLPEFSVKNYGLKALFTSASAALGLEALNTDPDTALDKLKAALEKVFTFFSGTAQAATDIMTGPKLASVKNSEYIQMYPLSDEGTPSPSVPDAPADNTPITPEAFFAALDTDGWNQKAKDALAAAQRGQPWGMQDIAYYAANGLEGIPRDYTRAGEAAIMARDTAEATGNRTILRLSTNFLKDLSTMGVFSEGTQTMNSPATEKPAITSATPTIHECDLERLVIEKYRMSCSAPSATVNVGDTIKVTMPDEIRLYKIGQDLAGHEMPLGSLFSRVYITNTGDDVERTLAQQIAWNVSNSATTAERQIASAPHPALP
jgi:hypothetical protein